MYDLSNAKHRHLIHSATHWSPLTQSEQARFLFTDRGRGHTTDQYKPANIYDDLPQILEFERPKNYWIKQWHLFLIRLLYKIAKDKSWTTEKASQNFIFYWLKYFLSALTILRVPELKESQILVWKLSLDLLFEFSLPLKLVPVTFQSNVAFFPASFEQKLSVFKRKLLWKFHQCYYHVVTHQAFHYLTRILWLYQAKNKISYVFLAVNLLQISPGD